jgi:hypothetical protein
MSLEIAWKQNILVKDSNLLKLLLVVLGFGSQTFICGFSRQNICSVGQKTEFVRSFFGRIRGYQKSFRNNLTFIKENVVIQLSFFIRIATILIPKI